MLRLTCSNRLEFLRETLLDRLAAEECAPLFAQQVIVPSTALRRHLELACADRFGICANIDFSFLAQWLWARIAQLVDVEQSSPFATSWLTWRIYEIFGERAFYDTQPRLASYLHSADPLMRLELAEQSARLLEQYITYRPEWLAAWADGRDAGISGLDAAQRADERWQAALWRRLGEQLGIGRQHPAALFFERVAQLGDDARRALGWPENVHVFCLPSMPPLYLEILRRLAGWLDMHLYVLNPCREYWFEIVDGKRLRYLAARGQAAWHEVGNRLLASWGKQTQAHIDLLFSDEGQIVEQDSEFFANRTAVGGTPAAAPSLLAEIQNAILDLRDLAPGSVSPAPTDRSLEVHVCHSLTRELEVLHDQLLALFCTKDAPSAAEIVVLLPNLHAAAPLIEAVFGSAPAGRRIPYAITGLPQTRVNPVARALDSLMTLCDGRFSASAVFGFLQQAPVAARFALGATELAWLHDWINEAGMRWGLDADSRRRLDLPVDAQHSFADGFQRLFLAYALGDEPDARRTVIAGRVAAAQVTGQQALALGRGWQFIKALESVRAAWASSLPPADWQASLNAALAQFIASDTGLADDLRVVQAAIGELHLHLLRGGARSPLPLAVVHRALNALLDDPARGGVPGGVLTFAALGNLRALPYRHVCVLGLNDGVFPSANRPAEFDLIAARPQRGDRQRRDDERNLFLDVLLAARHSLYLSYSGRSQRDNSPLPPSVLLAELLDYAALACARDPDDAGSVAAARQRLIVEHPLQAFSIDCFLPDADPRQQSFNAEYAAALQRRWQVQAAGTPSFQRRRSCNTGCFDAEEDEAGDGDARMSDPALPLFTRPLPPPAAEWRQVDGASLLRFFRQPCRFLLGQRLHIALHAADEPLQDDEPFLADYPSQQALIRRLLPLLLAGATEDEARALALAGNELPGGAFGEQLIDSEVANLHAFAAELRPWLAQPRRDLPPRPLTYLIDGEAWQLSASLSDVRAGGLLRYRYADAKAGDYLAGWIEHLLLCASAPAGVEMLTTWHARGGHYRLRPCAADAARRHLGELLTLYRDGLCQPLPFFPKSAWAYVNADDNALAAAQRAWHHARHFAWGEEADPAYQLAWRGVADPLDERFVDCAQRVFTPLLAHLEEVPR